jgi:hypothetical protein
MIMLCGCGRYSHTCNETAIELVSCVEDLPGQISDVTHCIVMSCLRSHGMNVYHSQVLEIQIKLFGGIYLNSQRFSNQNQQASANSRD